MTGSPEPNKETVRIHLPTRPPPDPSPPSNSPSAVRVTAAAMPIPMTAHAPKKETFSIAELPDPAVKPAVEMKKTQPSIDLLAVETPVTKVAIASSSQPAAQMRIDDIPTSLYWALLATSAAILILQIWNYLS